MKQDNNVYTDVAKHAALGATLGGGIEAVKAYGKYRKAKADGKSAEEIKAAKKDIYAKAAKGAAGGALGAGAFKYMIRTNQGGTKLSNLFDKIREKSDQKANSTIDFTE